MKLEVGGNASHVRPNYDMEQLVALRDELTVEGMLREMLDKSIACDDINASVVSGPNTLEEYDKIRE